MVEGLDLLVVEMERTWGVGRLRLLVSGQRRAKFDEQKDRLDQAIGTNQEGYVRIQVEGMRRAWQALDWSAREAGAARLAPTVCADTGDMVSGRVDRGQGSSGRPQLIPPEGDHHG